MAGNVSSAKAALRRELLRWRRALEPDEVARRGGEVQRRLAALVSLHAGLTVGLYASDPSSGEVPTRWLFELLRARGIRCAFPRASDGTRLLTFHVVQSWEELQAAPRLRVLEPPADGPPVALTEVDTFVVPGVAFSLTGARLGRGGGHYDTTLAASSGWRVALGWEGCLRAELPVEPSDTPMDALVTEARTLLWRQPAPRI